MIQNEDFYITMNDKLQCILCPNFCLLKDGKFGICNTRKRANEQIINPFAGVISSSGIDPIEKKPLYHFLPGSHIYSLGFYGCTLKCQFCQNASISQFQPFGKEKKMTPPEVVRFLQKNNHKSIAFTYSEPTLYFEWILETAKLCKENDINTVLITNGYLNPRPAEILLDYIDATNIDIKGATEEFYNKHCHGKLAPVKKFTEIAYEKDVHVELTTLVIPHTNDTIDQCESITDFIAGINCEIPYHISRYHPAYNFSEPPTPVETILKWLACAKKKLKYVYGGNILDYSDTFCKNCGELLVKRDYYSINIKSLDAQGNCQKCSTHNHFKM